MSNDRDYRRRIALYVGPGGPTCPCCRAATGPLRKKVMRAAKRSERQRARQAALEEASMIGHETPEEVAFGRGCDAEYDLVEQGKHHTDWWAWWVNGCDEDDAWCFAPALFEGWG